MIRNLLIYSFILVWCIQTAASQEVVSGLQVNSVIARSAMKETAKKSDVKAAALELPFIDDFSGRSVFPDQDKWSDNYVYINNDYTKDQITLGVATFDAIGNYGRMYENASSSVFKGDELTSQQINLSYNPADNIRLSFFYQAGGLGDSPEQNDSLTLQFFAPDENKWYSVWNAKGTSDTRFKPVIIKVENTRFLKTGFRFRFTNYASLSPNLIEPSIVGNCDMWNIDYVYLGKNRNDNDTIFADVAFRRPIRSLLKTYEAMPWKQFRKIELQEMSSSIQLQYRNNDQITRNVTRNFEIWDVYAGKQSDSFTEGAVDIKPFTSEVFNANLIYTFSTNSTDSALFRITCSLKTDVNDRKENDTIIYYQTFKNYFAFDDGSSEAGYGINGLGSRNAMAAYKFISYIPDTLKAIQICFNDSYMNANQMSFDLMVWDNNNGLPGNILYSAEDSLVKQGNQINGFYTYRIKDGVPVNGTFYVGWKQRSEAFLNAGLDINTPNGGRQFYWLNGEWNQSQVQGTLMIRPVVEYLPKITAVNEIKYLGNKIKTGPNPATDYFNIYEGEQQLSGNSTIKVIDLSGKELLKIPFTTRIDISSLANGIYFLIITKNGTPVSYTRFIKSM